MKGDKLMFSVGVASVLVALGLVVYKATDLATRYLDKPGLAALASIGSAVLIIAIGAFVVWQAMSG
jgi:ABC-type nickel/cobalt efflux system permease component RcnA